MKRLSRFIAEHWLLCTVLSNMIVGLIFGATWIALGICLYVIYKHELPPFTRESLGLLALLGWVGLIVVSSIFDLQKKLRRRSKRKKNLAVGTP